ncbi:STAS domain-containing protein [Streptomyces sp. ODS05-4]|uniref:STAS domain-containing protein n=1 Tax=Streptomyces sp. ODS05-4 TaxID=2944939 RepID=UPI002109C320|nr:STAS domain-containing protein [Streptomyces sp. ODS05-4]
MFSVQVSQRTHGVVVALRGELDFDSVVQLHEVSERELARDPRSGPLVIDCAALSFCDSTGISALVRLYQQMAVRQRPLRLAALPDTLARLLAVTGLDRVLTVCADVDAALAAGQGRGQDQESRAGAGPDDPAPSKERQTT